MYGRETRAAGGAGGATMVTNDRFDGRRPTDIKASRRGPGPGRWCARQRVAGSPRGRWPPGPLAGAVTGPGSLSPSLKTLVLELECCQKCAGRPGGQTRRCACRAGRRPACPGRFQARRVPSESFPSPATKGSLDPRPGPYSEGARRRRAHRTAAAAAGRRTWRYSYKRRGRASGHRLGYHDLVPARADSDDTGGACLARCQGRAGASGFCPDSDWECPGGGGGRGRAGAGARAMWRGDARGGDVREARAVAAATSHMAVSMRSKSRTQLH